MGKSDLGWCVREGVVPCPRVAKRVTSALVTDRIGSAVSSLIGIRNGIWGRLAGRLWRWIKIKLLSICSLCSGKMTLCSALFCLLYWLSGVQVHVPSVVSIPSGRVGCGRVCGCCRSCAGACGCGRGRYGGLVWLVVWCVCKQKPRTRTWRNWSRLLSVSSQGGETCGDRGASFGWFAFSVTAPPARSS